MSIRLRRDLLLVALMVVAGALLLAVGTSSPTEAQSPETQQPSTPPARAGAAETMEQQQTPGSSQLLRQLNSEGARVPPSGDG